MRSEFLELILLKVKMTLKIWNNILIPIRLTPIKWLDMSFINLQKKYICIIIQSRLLVRMFHLFNILPLTLLKKKKGYKKKSFFFICIRSACNEFVENS